MARKHETPDPLPDAADQAAVNDAFALTESAAPKTNGTPLIDAPNKAGRRAKRDPNAPRPLYLLVAVSHATGVMRIVGTAPTVGQARKALPGAAYGVRDGEYGPAIARCKLVS